MAEAIRFYMDQHFPFPASRGLRRHGIDVLTAQEAAGAILRTPINLAFANSEDRVLVSFDADFLAPTSVRALTCRNRLVPRTEVRHRPAYPGAVARAWRARSRRHAESRGVPLTEVRRFLADDSPHQSLLALPKLVDPSPEAVTASFIGLLRRELLRRLVRHERLLLQPFSA